MEACARVTGVRVLDGYRLELTFTDGFRGQVDLAPRILGRGGLYHALEAPEFFQQVQVNAELGTIFWPNGVDLCPDLLRSWAGGAPVGQPQPETTA